MDILIKILQFILSFSLLVIIHELGHFLFARLFGTRVEKFYLFFNPWFSLFKFKRGETEYGVGWIPFGGYVKIAGMIDESMDTEQLKQPVQPWEFRAKPAWQRLLIMVGGVVMNIVLALCIYIGISYTWGDNYIASKNVKYGYVFNEVGKEFGFKDGDKIIDVEGKQIEDFARIMPTIIVDQAKYVTVERDGKPLRITMPETATAKILDAQGFMTLRLPFVVGETVKGQGAAKAGLQPGDTLVAFNGKAMRYFDQFQTELAAHKGQKVDLSIARDSAGITRIITLPVEVSQEGLIGVRVAPLNELLKISTHRYTFWQAIPQGIKRAGTEMVGYAKQIKLLFSPKTEAYKSLGGIMALGSFFPTTWDWESFWTITAFFSVALAFMNILPIPGLDGGHVLFLLVEVITRRKPSDKFMERATTVGFIILIALLLFANGNDIYRFFIK